MKTTISFRALAIALFIALSVSFTLCILGDALFGWTMYQAWAPLLPGFAWPVSFGEYLLGLLWLIGYSLYAAALIALPYNYFAARQRTA